MAAVDDEFFEQLIRCVHRYADRPRDIQIRELKQEFDRWMYGQRHEPADLNMMIIE